MELPMIQTQDIPQATVDLTCLNYIHQDLLNIHQFSQPHNIEFIEQVMRSLFKRVINKLNTAPYRFTSQKFFVMT